MNSDFITKIKVHLNMVQIKQIMKILLTITVNGNF